MNKKTSLLIGVQAIIIILLFWSLVFYSKDEYESYQSAQEEEIESPGHVSADDNITVVQLTAITQKNSDITTSKIKAAHYQGSLKTYGSVVSIDDLIAAKTQYNTLKTDLQLARSENTHHASQYQRLKALNDDDKNVSDSAAQEALALLNADNAKISAIQSQLNNLASSIKLQWGAELSKLIIGEASPSHLNDLLTRKNVLIQISLPLNMDTPKSGASIYINTINGSATPIKAVYISPATSADQTGTGKTFYYSAPAEYLRTGMRISAAINTSDKQDSTGVLIPNSAVIWHDGKPWVYLKTNNEQFQRTPIEADIEVGDSWFTQNLKPDSEIVTGGAQLLLSEEFKYLIKNENED